MDTIDFTRFIFAFFFVMGLIGACALLLKRYGRPAMFGVKESGGRLGVIETRWLDSKTKLLLIRRDEAEHLLLVADGKPTVIESNIEAAAHE